jgi:hypothetical protein
MTTQDSRIIEAINRYGGSFAKALARTFQLADDTNRARIKLAFADLFEHYAMMAKNMPERTDSP